MDVERITGREILGEDIVCVWLSGPEFNRLRFDASIATAMMPGRFPSLSEFLDVGDDV